MTYRTVPERTVATGGANAVASLSTPLGGANRRRVLSVAVAYSGAPTQAGVTLEIDSGAGAAYDTLVATGSANARFTFWQPTGDLILLCDDALKVTAPAGGGSLTASITIVSEAC